MSIPSTQFKVLVVGGGIAGLAFARQLSKHPDIEVTVYEQSREESQSQQYPIHLAPEGRAALKEILPPEDFARLVARVAPRGIEHGGIHISTPQWRRIFAIERHRGDQPQMVLRRVLKDTLGDGVTVVRGRRVVGYEETQGGRIRLIFEEGGPEEGDLLVGADGVGSRVRAQLVPSHARLPILPFVCIQMNMPYSTPMNEHFGDKAGLNMVLGSLNYSIVFAAISPFGVSQSGSAETEDSSTRLDSAGLTYAVFTCLSWPGWKAADEATLKLHCLELLEADNAHPSLVNSLKDAYEGSVSAWQVFDGASAQAQWDNDRVVLIGDAAHAMPPFGGVAGSTSIKDGVQLAQAITTSNRFDAAGPPLGKALQDFQSEMRDRTTRLSDDSKRRLYLSSKEGFRVWTRWLLFRIMDYCLPFALWVLSRRRDRMLGS